MDWHLITSMLTALAVLITATTGLIAVVAKLWAERHANRRKVQQNTDDIEMIWQGSMERGFVGAMLPPHKYLKIVSDPSRPFIIADDKVREHYAPKLKEFQALRGKLKADIGREPSRFELGMAIEREYRTWLIKNICPVLHMKDNECIAVAVVLATEDGGNGYLAGVSA